MINRLLRFMTCSSLDAGKFTLTGHMIYDAKLLLEGQKNSKDLESKIGLVMPVQRALRFGGVFMGFQEESEAGVVRSGNEITVLSSVEPAHVRSPYLVDESVDSARNGSPVTTQINNGVDASREHSLKGNDNLTRHETDITKDFRAMQKGQKPVTIWFTGLSGSGKSTLSNEVEKRLVTQGKHTMVLDGDNVRMGLNSDLGFCEHDRIENIRRISEVSKLMNDAGLIVITSFISPFANDRAKAREIIGEDFIEVYVSTPLQECERRDVKGLYAKARTGEIPNFTGISSPYEAPAAPQIVIDTSDFNVTECVEILLDKLKKYL